MTRAPAPETLAQVALENRRGEALTAKPVARPADYAAWAEEILELRRTYLEPGAADWYAGLSQPDHLVVVWMCRDVSRHAAEIRRRLTEPFRLRCKAASVPLAPLRAVEKALWEEFEDALNSSGIDFERNVVVVEADRDTAALAERLRRRFGDLVILEFGHAAQI